VKYNPGITGRPWRLACSLH